MDQQTKPIRICDINQLFSNTRPRAVRQTRVGKNNFIFTFSQYWTAVEHLGKSFFSMTINKKLNIVLH